MERRHMVNKSNPVLYTARRRASYTSPLRASSSYTRLVTQKARYEARTELVYEPAVIRGSYGGSVRGSYGVGRGYRLTRLVQRFSTRLVKKNVVERRCGWSVWGHSAYGGREVYGDVTQVATTCEHKCELCINIGVNIGVNTWS